MFARNAYNTEFAGPRRVRRRSEAQPHRHRRPHRVPRPQRHAARIPRPWPRTRLSGRVGAGSIRAPRCRSPSTSRDGQEREIVFMPRRRPRHRRRQAQLVQRFRGAAGASERAGGGLALLEPHARRRLRRNTRSAVNVLANGWLVYQTLACRMWARTRLLPVRRRVRFPRSTAGRDGAGACRAARCSASICCACAARQFREGDVQHWWHPPVGRGVRTHFSDDYLWLPLATCRYVVTTGDTGVLDERVPFLEGAAGASRTKSRYYDLPARSERVGTLYEHCVRAIQQRLAASARTACR